MWVYLSAHWQLDLQFEWHKLTADLKWEHPFQERWLNDPEDWYIHLHFVAKIWKRWNHLPADRQSDLL